MHTVKIDRTKALHEEPHTGHNRWHPDIPPILSIEPGEEALLETRDASDGYVKPDMSADDLANRSKNTAHPLTGPIYVKGSQPGDLLAIEFVDIIPKSYGYTSIKPGAGFLQDLFPGYYLVHWDMDQEWATSRQLPSVRIPNGSFMGTAGLAPSHEQLFRWNKRELELSRRGGFAALPDPQDAVPSTEPFASQGLRTVPPRENGGNLDIKQLTKGSRLLIPVHVEGGLFSVGDAHYAQGDSECCITAIEMAATTIVRFRILKDEAKRHGITWPRLSHPGLFAPPKWAIPQNFIATMGMPIRDDGVQEDGDVTLAARNALINMIHLLEERGWSSEQAYIICSVCVDLRISNLVDLPNVTVCAFLPEDIFMP